jgi:hypothetical protein
MRPPVKVRRILLAIAVCVPAAFLARYYMHEAHDALVELVLRRHFKSLYDRGHHYTLPIACVITIFFLRSMVKKYGTEWAERIAILAVILS